MPISTLETDAWLGGVLGRDAFRLSFSAGDKRLVPASKPPPTCEAVFIYTKVDVNAHENVRLLLNLGFTLVDTNITFEKKLQSKHDLGSETQSIRLARAQDVEQVVKLAKVSFRKSRFHNDSLISTAVADRLKGEWVRNFFLGARGDAMVVAESADGIAGFLLLLKNKEALTIDLVAVDEAHRGKGLAAAMTRFSEKTFPQPTLVRVGTQIGNAPAIQAYQKQGFTLVQSQYIFHYHGAMPTSFLEAHS